MKKNVRNVLIMNKMIYDIKLIYDINLRKEMNERRSNY